MSRYTVTIPFAGYFLAEVVEWDLLEHITRGNICYARENDAHADKMKDDDDAA